MPVHEFELFGDLKYCPASFEVRDVKRENRRRIMYVLPYTEINPNDKIIATTSGTTAATNASSLMNNDNIHIALRLRSYSEIIKALIMLPLPRLHKNKKFSVEERKRRQIIESYRQALHSSTISSTNTIADTIPSASRIRALLGQPNTFDHNFLSKPNDILYYDINNKNKKNITSSQWEGCVMLAKSNRHWIEKYIIVSHTNILLLKSANHKKQSISISMNKIISIRPLNSNEKPFLKYDIFEIETSARIYYFMIKTEKILIDWLNIFISILGNNIVKLKSTDIIKYSKLSEIEEAYISKSFGWKLEKRRIFNYKKIFFNNNTSTITSNSTSTTSSITNSTINLVTNQLLKMKPVNLTENILKKAFNLAEINDKNLTSDPILWCEFCNEISYLQTINVSIMNENEKIAFFLNVYHIMILHGSIVLGLPMTWMNWQSFFNTVTYVIDCDIISIAELEHNILR